MLWVFLGIALALPLLRPVSRIVSGLWAELEAASHPEDVEQSLSDLDHANDHALKRFHLERVRGQEAPKTTALERQKSLFLLLAAFPEARATRIAVQAALSDPDPFVALYASLYATKGQLLAWRRLALSEEAPAAIRLLSLFYLSSTLSEVEQRSLLLQAALGPVGAAEEANDTDAIERVVVGLKKLVLLWRQTLDDQPFLRGRFEGMVGTPALDFSWKRRKRESLRGSRMGLSHAHHHIYAELYRGAVTSLYGIEVYWRDRAEEKRVTSVALLGRSLEELLGLSLTHTNQVLSSLQILQEIGHPVAEPGLLVCLEDPKEDVREATIGALATCGTGAAVKPLQRYRKKASTLHQARVDRAIKQIQLRLTAIEGGLSIVSDADETDARGRLSVTDDAQEPRRHEAQGHLSMVESPDARRS